MKTDQMLRLKSIGISAVLITANILVMGGFARTPVSADIVSAAFQYPIIGVLLFGAVLTAGTYILDRGVRDSNVGMAGAGLVLLQIGYGLFGGGLLALAPAQLQISILVVTTVITVGIAVLAAGLVYFTDRDYSNWQRYAMYAFLGLLGTAFIGTFATPVLVAAFILAFTGFFCLLVYDIWRTKRRPEQVVLNGTAIYSAFMGVFVHVLQLVIRYYLRR